MNNEINGENSLNGIDNNVQNTQPTDLNNQPIDNNINNQNPINENQMNNSSLGTDNMFQTPTGMTDQQSQMNQQIPMENINNNIQPEQNTVDTTFATPSPNNVEQPTAIQEMPTENINMGNNINPNVQPQNIVNNQPMTQPQPTNNKNNIFNENIKNASNDGELRIAIKKDAKENVKLGIGAALIVGTIGIFVLSLIFGFILSIIPYGALLSPLVSIALIVMLVTGICASGLDNARGKNSGFGATLIWPFKHIKRSLCCVALVLADVLGMGIIIFVLYKIIGVNLLTLIIISLLVIINYAIIYPILSGMFYLFIDEENNLSFKENIINGYNLYKNNIMQVLALDVSYIGWMLLAPFTLGILCIWLIPYVAKAKGNFYLNIINKKQFTPTEKGVSDKTIYIIYIILMVLSLSSTVMRLKDSVYIYSSLNNIVEDSKFDYEYDDEDENKNKNLPKNEVSDDGYKVVFNIPSNYKVSSSSDSDSRHFDSTGSSYHSAYIYISNFYSVSGEYSEIDDDYEYYKENKDYTEVHRGDEKTIVINGKEFKYKVLTYKGVDSGTDYCMAEYSYAIVNNEDEEVYYNVRFEGHKEPTKNDLKFLNIKVTKE